MKGLGPKIMRTISEKELTDNQKEISSEFLKGSDEKDLTSGGKTLTPRPGTVIGDCEVLRRDSNKEELLDLCPEKENF